MRDQAAAYLKTGEEGTMRDALDVVDQEIRILEAGIASGLADALRAGLGTDPKLMRRAVEELEKELNGKLEYRGRLSARLDQSTAEVDRLQRLSQL